MTNGNTASSNPKVAVVTGGSRGLGRDTVTKPRPAWC